jgi:hypothetical protein
MKIYATGDVSVRERINRSINWLFHPPLVEPNHGDHPFVESHGWEWGWFPAISLIGSLCLLVVAYSFNLARHHHPYRELVFWSGLLPFYALIAWRLVSPDPSRRERVALILLAGIGLYMVKVMHSPMYFTFYDELLHYRTVANILDSGRQFVENPLLPVSPLYPGLENIAVALVQLGGLDIFSAGVVTILAARAVLVFVLFLFYEKTSESPRLAGVATLIYASNPHFIFFDAQFSYESLALMFVVIVLLSIEYRLHHHKERPLGASLLLIFGICATMVTHHVTSYFLVISLVLWAGIAFIFPYKGQNRTALFGSASLAIVAIFSWMMYVAIVTIDYLVPVLSGALIDLFKVLLREETGRQLFTSDIGNVLQLWERVIIYGTAFFIMAGLLVGGSLLWRENRNRTTYLFLGVVGMIYPITQLLRFSSKGLEIASRVGPFMFLGIAFVVGIGITKIYTPSGTTSSWVKRAGMTLFLLVIFWGNFLVSFPRWALMPGPFMASADTRSVDARSMNMALWASQNLESSQRFAADRINGLLIVAYGHQYQVTGSWSNLNVPGIFLDIPFSEVEYRTLCEGKINYLVIDYRFTSYVPMLGFYYESGESKQRYQEPLERAVLDKFKVLDELSLIYDDGTFSIYQVDLSACDR